MKVVNIFLVIFYFFITSCNEKAKSKVPEFVTKQLNADTVNLKVLAENKVTVIFFWTTFCDNCLTEISNIHFIYDKYKSNTNFNFVTIAFNTEEELKQFNSLRDTTNPYQQYLNYLKLDKFDIPVLIGAKQGYEIYPQDDGSFIAGIRDTMEVSRLYKTFGFQGLPTTYIYSKKGELVYKHSGSKSVKANLDEYKAFLENKIDSLLNL